MVGPAGPPSADAPSGALDLRGHGKSAAPANNDYAVESLAADIGAVVDSLHLDRFVLVGHSMGGAAAIAYAATHPDRVAGLVMVGAPGRTPPNRAGRSWRRSKRSTTRSPPPTGNGF